MKFILNRQQDLKTRFLFHETGTDDHIDNIADELRNRTEQVDLSETEIHELAHRFAKLVTENENFAAAFQAALGEQVEAAEVDTWVQTLETHLEASSGTKRATERALAAPNDEKEPSGVAIPLTAAEFETIYNNLDTNIDIPEEMKADIQGYVLHNLETSANPDDNDNTERLDQEEIDSQAQVMIENHAIYLKTLAFGNTQIDGTPMPADPEENTESIGDITRRVSKEFDHVSPTMLMRAMASNHEGFGLNEDGEPIPLTEDSIRELAEQLNQTGETIDRELQAQGLTPGTPEYRQAYNDRMNNTINSLSDVKTLGDLLQLLLRWAYPERYGDEGGPFDSNGRPLGTALPQGNYRPRGLENVEGHVENITLNPEFYGQELIEEFSQLPEQYITAANTITEDAEWGTGTLSENLESGGDINGWRLAVMRNAVNAHRYGQDFSADKPFLANDLGTYRAVIYYPGEGSIAVPCYGGSGGISNVSESHGSPLGSFHFSNATDRGSHRYGWSSTVNGMEPMRDNYRTDYDQGPNIDPGSGNANSAGRAILMHGSNGRTWGCWGIPRDEAIRFGQVLQQRGGGNGEAFVSTA